MLAEEADRVVQGLVAQRVFAHVWQGSVGGSYGVRIVLSNGREALWDGDGAAGLDAQVLRDGVLVGFVPMIPESADFTVEQTIAAIAGADYGDG